MGCGGVVEVAVYPGGLVGMVAKAGGNLISGKPFRLRKRLRV